MKALVAAMILTLSLPAFAVEVAKLEVTEKSRLLMTAEEKAKEAADKKAEYFRKKRESIERLRATKEPKKEEAKEAPKK
jgi:hypothetical protein